MLAGYGIDRMDGILDQVDGPALLGVQFRKAPSIISRLIISYASVPTAQAKTQTNPLRCDAIPEPLPRP
jgi:hypothetical protein